MKDRPFFLKRRRLLRVSLLFGGRLEEVIATLRIAATLHGTRQEHNANAHTCGSTIKKMETNYSNGANTDQSMSPFSSSSMAATPPPSSVPNRFIFLFSASPSFSLSSSSLPLSSSLVSVSTRIFATEILWYALFL